MVREAIDAVGSGRWQSPEIRRRLAATFDDEWATLLDAAPYYRAQVVAVATAPDGKFPLTALDTGTGPTARRFYRILSVNDGSGIFTERRFDEVPMGTVTNYLPSGAGLFYLMGTDYQVLPVAPYTLNVAVNYKPAGLSTLAADEHFDWPAGSEYVLAYAAGAMLLNKGGAEAAAAGELNAMANEERNRMLNELRRRTITPTIMAPPDRREDWAG